jgi:hypothetical protein
MSGVRMEVLVAAYESPGAARSDYRALVALYHRGSLRETKAIVLLTSDDRGRVDVDETGGGLTGKLIGQAVRHGHGGRLPPSAGSVVAIFDAHARPEVERAIGTNLRRAYATADGSDDRALADAFAAAELELAGDAGER